MWDIETGNCRATIKDVRATGCDATELLSMGLRRAEGVVKRQVTAQCDYPSVLFAVTKKIE